MCTTCGFSAGGAGPAAYHPFAFCALVKQLGSVSAEANLAAVIRDARSDDPNVQTRVDEFVERAREPVPGPN